MATAEMSVPVERCGTCGVGVRLPNLAAKRNFDARGARCIGCATEPEALEEIIDTMLALTDWKKIPLGVKLRIAAEAAR